MIDAFLSKLYFDVEEAKSSSRYDYSTVNAISRKYKLEKT